jgi:integrase
MAHLVRQKKVYFVDANGKRCGRNKPGASKVVKELRKWYGAAIPGFPPRKRVPLATDRNVSLRMLAELVTKGERGEAGLTDSVVEAAAVPLARHLEDFEQSLRARETSDKQVRLCLTRLHKTFDGCGFVFPRDIEAEAVMNYLAGRRKLATTEGGLGAQTSNFYLKAIIQFCRWMVRKGRLAKNPMADTRTVNVRLDRRHDRRPLDADQLECLLAVTLDSPSSFRGLTGKDRYALYLTACGTGFRSQELATLVPESFDLGASPPSVTLPAKRGKNRRSIVQPLPAAVASHLRNYLKGKPAGRRVWPGTWWEKGAKMFRKDLESAGIPYVIDGPDGPLFADFHALRHSYITLLERSGVGPKAAQTLARHGDIRLTLGRYTHTDQATLGAAVDKLPLPGAAKEDQWTPEQMAAGMLLYGSLLGVLLGGVDTPLRRTEKRKVETNPDAAGQKTRKERRKTG